MTRGEIILSMLRTRPFLFWPYIITPSLSLMGLTLNFFCPLSFTCELPIRRLLLKSILFRTEPSAVFGSTLNLSLISTECCSIWKDVLMSFEIFYDTTFFSILLVLSNSSCSYFFSCLSKPRLGQTFFLLLLTNAIAYLKPIFLVFIK